MKNNQPLVILGCGGHARSVADVALTIEFSSLLFVDENAQPNESILGFPVVKDFQKSKDMLYFSARGNNISRKRDIEGLLKEGVQVVNIISPFATVSPYAT